MPPRKRVIHYSRVSAEEQADEGKDSIPDQIKRQRDRSAAMGWEVVDEIVIDGFSGRYWTYLEFSQAAALKNFPDPMRMWRHWEHKTFDILSCRDLSRLGREQSILSEFVGRTIAAGATIMPLDEAPLDALNYRMSSAIGGMSAAQHVDNLIRYREMGMTRRAKDGRRVGMKAPAFFMDVFDKKNKHIGIKPDRGQFQRFFDNFPNAYCEAQLSYRAIGQHLYDEFGIVDPLTNRPYKPHVFMTMLYNPATWGHMAYGVRRQGSRYEYKNQMWVTGDEPAPESVNIFYNATEPIWVSPTAERVKSELRFRHYVLKGRMQHRGRYMFSGLLVCPICHSNLGGSHKVTQYGDYMYYRCVGLFGTTPPKNCDNRQYVPEVEVIDFLKPYIERLIAGVSPSELIPSIQAAPTINYDLLDAEIIEAETSMRDLSRRIPKQKEHAARIMQEEIDAYSDRISILIKQRNASIAATAFDTYAAIDQQVALNELRQINLQEFWAQSPYAVNQWLHRLFGDVRITVHNRDITGFVLLQRG